MAVSIDLNGSTSGVNAEGNVAIGTPITVFPPNTINITSTSGQLSRLTVSINGLLDPILFSENFNVTTASGISASYNPLLGVLTLTSTTPVTGTSSVSLFQQTLESLQYNTQPLLPFIVPINDRSFTVAGFESALSVLPGATALVTLDVTNNPPTNIAPIAVADIAVTDQDEAITINVLANDTDVNVGDVLTVESFTDPTNGSVTRNQDGSLTYTPDSGYSGLDSFTYVVSDGKGGTSTGTVGVTVNPIVVNPPTNIAPVAVADIAVTDQDEATTINVLANDTDVNVGDVLTVESFTDPTNGSVTRNQDGSLTYTPDSGYSGLDSFTYVVSDGKGGTSTGTVGVTVNPIVVNPPTNIAPVAVADIAVTDQDESTTINVLGNDTDVNVGDVLTVESFTDPANGSVTRNQDGTLTYTPDSGYSGLDSFTYVVSDGKGGTSTGTVGVTVNPIVVNPPTNIAPVAVADVAVTDQDEAITINVLGNDTDVNVGDVLTVESFTDPTNGSVTRNQDGTLTYTPDSGYSGLDSFTYVVSDGKGGTSTGTVGVTVNPIVVNPPTNIAPVAVADVAVTDQDESTTINVLGNDTDVNVGDVLTVESFTDPTNGSVTRNQDGSLTYTPDSGYSGLDSFTYVVSDGKGGTSTGTVGVTVNPIVVNPPVNAAPIATGDTATTTAGNAITTSNVLENDSDPDADDLSITNFSQGTSGTVTNNGDGTFTYTPNAGFTGNDSFTYTISDGNGGTAVGTVAVTVNSANTTTNVFNGTNSSETATASSAQDIFDMAGGDDTVNASFDNLKQQDSIDGGSGSNTFVLTGGTATDSITLRSATVSDPNNLIGGTGLAGTTIRNFQRFDLSGFSGRTTLTVSNLQDTLIGGAGDDTVNAAFDNLKQSDNLDAGAGSNSFVLLGGTATDSITLRSATTSDANNLVTGTGLTGTVIRNFQNFDLSGFAGRTTLTGNDLANTLIGGSGNDSITGGAGNDTLTGNAGNDVLNGGTGNDVLNGGAGNDRYLVDSTGDRIIDSAGIDSVTSSINLTLQAGLENLTLSGRATIGAGNSLNNVIVGNNVRNTLVGNAGNDRLFGNGGDDLLRGGLGKDRLSGGAGNDRLFGDDGTDILSGDAGNDSLLGGGGKDTLNGGLGSDRLTGGAGKDRLTGGAGRDSFTFDNVRTGSIDVITDFRSVDDTILVSKRGFSQELRVGSLSASQFVLGSRAQDQNDRFLYDQRTGGLFFDADGVGGASQVRIATLSSRTAISAADIAIIA